MKRNVILAAVTLVAFAAGTWVGFLLSRRNVVTYAVPDPYGGSRRAVHLDWPTYGLPLVEYQHFLELLDAGRTNLHRELLDGLLDMALFDASFRRPELPAVQREILDTAIADTAAYRQVHPRSVELGDPADTEGFWQNHQATVDALLDEVKSEAGKQDEIERE